MDMVQESFSSHPSRQPSWNNTGNNSGFKRKKRKNGFFARAKKFGRQGKLGHGYEIDGETYSYFLRVLELCQKNEFDNDEEKDVFIENAFVQTENEEINLSSNQMTSRVLEKLLAESNNADILTRFTTKFTASLRTICTDQFASHVLEKLLHVISTKWTHNKSLMKWFRNTCKFVLNNFEDFIFDNFANRIMRKVCQCLSGSVDLFLNTSMKHSSMASNQFQNSTNKFALPSLNDLKGLRTSREEDSDSISKKNSKRNIKILKSFAQQFINWPQFNDLFEKELTSGFVQSFISSLVPIDDDLVSEAILQVVKAVKSINFHSSPQLFTIEVCVVMSADNDTIFKLLYGKYFEGKLADYALDASGHFILEKCLTSVSDSKLFEEMYTALEDQFEAIFNLGYLSVFTAISEACLRLKIKQSAFVDKLATLLGNIATTENKNKDENSSKSKKKGRKPVDEDSKEDQHRENFVELLCRFGKPIVKREDGTPHFQTELHGSMVLQNIVQFHKPFKVVSSILELDGHRLKQLVADPKGSHVVDSFFKSTTISDKYKDQFVLKLKDHLVSLASHKFGARVLDNYWPIASIKNKGIIAACLSEREAQLNANQYGKFLSTKCGLSLYKRNLKQWTEIMSSDAQAKTKKREKLADNIMTSLGLDSTKLSSKKRKVEKVASNSQLS